MNVFRRIQLVGACVFLLTAFDCHDHGGVHPQGIERDITINSCAASPITLHTNGSVAAADTTAWENYDSYEYTPEFVQSSPFSTNAEVPIPPKNSSTGKPGSSNVQQLSQSTVDNCAGSTPDPKTCDFYYKLKKDDGTYCSGKPKEAVRQFIMHVKG